MKQYFTFDPHTYDYWPIYEAIKKHYPLGIFQDDDDVDFYQSYAGLQEVRKRIEENIVEDNNYALRWVDFVTDLKSEFNNEIQVTTYGQAPCFSAFITLEEFNTPRIIITKELHFAVSLLGPFYSIYGIDSTVLTLGKEIYNKTDLPSSSVVDDKLEYKDAINALTVSPYQEYQVYFSQLEKRIKERFVGYRLIPHSINCMYLSGLTLYNAFTENKKSRTVFNGLFHNHFNINIESHLIRGDEEYGSKPWEI